MKKFVAFGMGALMALGFAACSDDDSLGNEPAPTSKTESSYISVSLNDTGYGSTRSGSEQYEYGSGQENAANNLQFLFYDKDGKYLSKGIVYRGVTLSDGTTENVEKFGKAIVEVQFQEDNMPKYMITVMNGPDYNPTVGASSENLLNETLDNYLEGNYFIMTTSSYKDEGTDEDATTKNKVYYGTVLEKDNFMNLADATTSANTAAVTEGKDVVVYIERVAAKLRLNFDMKRHYTVGKNDALYLGKFEIQDENADGKLSTQDKDLYVKFIGWGPNATTKDTYLMKHINLNWNLGWTWNNASYYRSFWAESTVYDNKFNGKAPTYYNDKTADVTSYQANAVTNNGKQYTGYQLNYASANSLKDQSTSSALYTLENTNTADVLYDANDSDKYIASAVTNILLIGQLYYDKECTNLADNLIKMGGGYWTISGAKNAIFNAKVGSTEYKKADGSALTVADCSIVPDEYLNGHVTLAVPEGVTDASGADATATLNAAFQAYNNEDNEPAIKYTDGLTYYYAPVYHLNYTNADASGMPNEKQYQEGYFGVVRNHIYDITINGFKSTAKEDEDNPIPNPSTPTGKDPQDPENPTDPDDPANNPGDDDPSDPGMEDPTPTDPGHGIDDPDEPIIPNPEEETNYYISTQINILSWRVVSQYVKI